MTKFKFEDTTGDVDIFDFKCHKWIYKLMKNYYYGIELWLRSAALIEYLYVYGNKKMRKEYRATLREKMAYSQARLIKFLDQQSEMIETKQYVWSWFKHFYNDPKVVREKYIYFWHLSGTKKYENHNPGVFFNRAYQHMVDENAKKYCDDSDAKNLNEIVFV